MSQTTNLLDTQFSAIDDVQLGAVTGGKIIRPKSDPNPPLSGQEMVKAFGQAAIWAGVGSAGGPIGFVLGGVGGFASSVWGDLMA